MTRSETKIERIVYTFTQDDVIAALVKATCTGEALKPTGAPHRFRFHADGSVEFIYDFVNNK